MNSSLTFTQVPILSARLEPLPCAPGSPQSPRAPLLPLANPLQARRRRAGAPVSQGATPLRSFASPLLGLNGAPTNFVSFPQRRDYSSCGRVFTSFLFGLSPQPYSFMIKSSFIDKKLNKLQSIVSTILLYCVSPSGHSFKAISRIFFSVRCLSERSLLNEPLSAFSSIIPHKSSLRPSLFLPQLQTALPSAPEPVLHHYVKTSLPPIPSQPHRCPFPNTVPKTSFVINFHSFFHHNPRRISHHRLWITLHHSRIQCPSP